jgi:hypothetical protein
MEPVLNNSANSKGGAIDLVTSPLLRLHLGAI